MHPSAARLCFYSPPCGCAARTPPLCCAGGLQPEHHRNHLKQDHTPRLRYPEALLPVSRPAQHQPLQLCVRSCWRQPRDSCPGSMPQSVCVFGAIVGWCVTGSVMPIDRAADCLGVCCVSAPACSAAPSTAAAWAPSSLSSWQHSIACGGWSPPPS